MAGMGSKQWAIGKLNSSKLLEDGAIVERHQENAAGMFEMAAHNSSLIAFSGPYPVIRTSAKHMAVRQYLYAIDGFVNLGDFFRADSNFEGLMDLYPRLSRKLKNDLNDFIRQWKDARREDSVPGIDLSTFRYALRK